jgi:polyisoprenoid-binding protein YceI
VITGPLTIRDVTRDIAVSLKRVHAGNTSAAGDSRIRFQCSCVIDRAAFGVGGGGVFGIADGLIGRNVRCEMEIEAGRVR